MGGQNIFYPWCGLVLHQFLDCVVTSIFSTEQLQGEITPGRISFFILAANHESTACIKGMFP